MKLQARINCNLIAIHLLLWYICLEKFKLVYYNYYLRGYVGPNHENKNTLVDFKSDYEKIESKRDMKCFFD